jgi:hypothetical protein
MIGLKQIQNFIINAGYTSFKFIYKKLPKIRVFTLKQMVWNRISEVKPSSKKINSTSYPLTVFSLHLHLAFSLSLYPPPPPSVFSATLVIFHFSIKTYRFWILQSPGLWEALYYQARLYVGTSNRLSSLCQLPPTAGWETWRGKGIIWSPQVLISENEVNPFSSAP